MMRGKGLMLGGALLCAGCSPGAAPPPTTSPGDGGRASTTTPAFAVEVLVQATGRGASEDEAYAAARVALAEIVLGDAAWTELVAVDLHRRQVDPQRVTPIAGGVEVALGLPRERVSSIVQELENAEPELNGPLVWQEPIIAYLRAHAAAEACLRRQQLFQATCEPSPTDEVDAALAELGQGLAFVAAYPDGVPVDANGRALREPAVFVVWRGVPLAGLPLRVEADRADALALDHLVSDAHGQARVTLASGVPMASLRLVIDGEAMLGPYRDAAPRTELRLEPRTVALGRWALLVGRGGTGANDAVATVVEARLRASGLGEARPLAPRDAEALRNAPAERIAPRLAAVADGMSGRLDLLLMLTYETHFAGRKGGGRMWYEAEGTLEARDAWTGEVRARAHAKVEADDVSDERADAAARRKLGETLAAEVLASLRKAGPR